MITYCAAHNCGRLLDGDDKQCPHGVWTCEDHDHADACDECYQAEAGPAPDLHAALARSVERVESIRAEQDAHDVTTIPRPDLTGGTVAIVPSPAIKVCEWCHGEIAMGAMHVHHIVTTYGTHSYHPACAGLPEPGGAA